MDARFHSSLYGKGYCVDNLKNVFLSSIQKRNPETRGRHQFLLVEYLDILHESLERKF